LPGAKETHANRHPAAVFRMKPLRVSILVAMASNRVIGQKNALPWHLPADLKHFKSLTMGHGIVMGRKTFESIGRPLPGRLNVVITRQKNYLVDGALVVHSIDEALQICKNNKAINGEGFIIGGAKLYQQTLSLCHRMYITEIQQCFDGDTFFPTFDPDEWVEAAREKHSSDNGNELAYDFVMLDRKVG
jgi:dihydrofolate reductase